MTYATLWGGDERLIDAGCKNNLIGVNWLHPKADT
jgi:hypothetical protein